MEQECVIGVSDKNEVLQSTDSSVQIVHSSGECTIKVSKSRGTKTVVMSTIGGMIHD